MTGLEAFQALFIGGIFVLTVGLLIDFARAPLGKGALYLFFAFVCGGLFSFMVRGVFHG